MTPDGISFFDPAMFVSLLGATEDRILSAKIHEAFRGLGNAIDTPHALLPILVGFLSILPDPLDIHSLLQKCWNDRLIASNAIVCQFGNFVHVTRVVRALKLLTPAPKASEHEPSIGYIMFCDGEEQLHVWGSPQF